MGTGTETARAEAVVDQQSAIAAPRSRRAPRWGRAPRAWPVAAADVTTADCRWIGEIRRKRLFDVLVAGIGLFLLLPAMAFIALLVRLDSRGPAFYRCRRVGYRGRWLWMLKFRKMPDGATGRGLTTASDERFTRIGAWLARTKVDEIPQLWHVLRGHMSIVGPRPENIEFVSLFPSQYAEILHAKPGIVGLSQLAFAEEGAVLDQEDPVGHYIKELLPQKVRMDCLYGERWSLWLDLRIVLWATIAVLLRRPLAVDRASGRITPRRRGAGE
jgi:lipopolysaccharide/colanic/teichoic acid biosynthesis glycosyltransferase